MIPSPPPKGEPIITGPSNPIITDKPNRRQLKRWRNINKLRGKAHVARNQ